MTSAIAATGFAAFTPSAGASPATSPPITAADWPFVVTQQADRDLGRQATITWTASTSPVKGWSVGRSGTDALGTGAWSTTVAGAARSHTFNYLLPGETYTFVVENLSTGASAQVTIMAEGAAAFTASAVETGPGTARLSWTADTSPASWTVGRDGTDALGTGAWSTTVAGAARSQDFARLVPGRTYALSVTAPDGRTASASVTITIPAAPTSTPTAAPTSTPTAAPTSTPTAAPTATATPSVTPTSVPVYPPATGGDWLSGVATDEKGNTNPAKAFADWRGSAIEIGQTWPHTLDLWSINPQVPNSWANWPGPMSISIAPGTASGKPIDQNGHKGWRGWKALANGENDSWWREAARNMKKLRAGKGTTFVSPMYEFNGDWMTWSVNGDVANFKAGWERMARIWKQEYPESVLVLPAACNRGVKEADLPAPSSYDMFGCTIYNAWPWETNGKATMASLEKARLQAKAVGKPIGITEWANSANGKTPGGGGEAPEFMKAMNDWMKANAGTGPGQLVFETFFNIDGYALDHRILPTTSQPKTAAEYQRLW